MTEDNGMDTVEQMIQKKGLTAPRVTPGDVTYEFERAEKKFYVFPDTAVTVCCAVLANGFCVVGKAAAASLENFDEQIGRTVAMKDAENQLWALLGFRLRDQLSKDESLG